VAVDSNAKQRIPPLFVEIMKTQDALRALKQGNPIPFQPTKDLIHEMQRFRKAAEIALSWNHNKGSTP
jgi:hypothetical protein